jgi:hypothetical protein
MGTIVGTTKPIEKPSPLLLAIIAWQRQLATKYK